LAGVSTNPYSSTLNALVNPNNGQTTVYFQWGTTTNYNNATPTTLLNQSLNTPQDVAISLEGLQAGTTYHFQAVAFNTAGTTFGGDVTFTTPLFPLPIITQVGPLSLAVGQTLVITNQANVQVTWSLDRTDPAGASITPDGIFTWTPSCQQGSITNQITIWATEVQNPSVSNYMGFPVTVSECVQVSVGSTAIQAGQSGCVPVNLTTTVALGDLQFLLVFPSNELSNWSITSTNLAVGAAILQGSSASQAQFNVSALAGRSLQGPATIAQLCFQSTAAPHSSFLPLVIAGLEGTETNGTVVGNAVGLPGRVAIVAVEPLLQASLGTNGTRVLTLYGNPGTNYVLQSAPDLSGGHWQTVLSATQTNVVQVFIGVGGTNPPIQFYRAYQQ